MLFKNVLLTSPAITIELKCRAPALPRSLPTNPKRYAQKFWQEFFWITSHIFIYLCCTKGLQKKLRRQNGYQGNIVVKKLKNIVKNCGNELGNSEWDALYILKDMCSKQPIIRLLYVELLS